MIRRCDFFSETEVGAETGQYRQLVDALESGTVEIEYILAAVDVGDAQVEFEY